MMSGKAVCQHKVQQTILNVGKDVFTEVRRKRKKEVLLRMHFLLSWLLCLHVGGTSLLHSAVKATSPSPAQSQPFSIAPVLAQTCSEGLVPE